jgi:hypothetical protein
MSSSKSSNDFALKKERGEDFGLKRERVLSEL